MRHLRALLDAVAVSVQMTDVALSVGVVLQRPCGPPSFWSFVFPQPSQNWVATKYIARVSSLSAASRNKSIAMS